MTERPAPAGDGPIVLPPEWRLAMAVLKLAARDMAKKPRPRGPRSVKPCPVEAAREWVDEAGEGFRFWCDVARLDPVRARRAMLGWGSARGRGWPTPRIEKGSRRDPHTDPEKP